LLAGTLILACSSCGVETTANYQVIPLPQEVALSQESPFNLNDGTIIAYPENNELLKRNAEFLAEYISQSTGHTLQTEALAPGSEAPKGAITLGLDPAIGNREGYVLTVKADRVTL
ncbi:UNVERIFIED_CONTAM: glycoside hydrolase family 20 zincin-like fold domain-containing protein, partial [Bacteroidetes bacterium 56_B9]